MFSSLRFADAGDAETAVVGGGSTFTFDLSLLGAGDINLGGQTQSGNAIVLLAGSTASAITAASGGSPRGTFTGAVGVIRCGGAGAAAEKRWTAVGGTVNTGGGFGGIAFGTAGNLSTGYYGYYFYSDGAGNWTARKISNATSAGGNGFSTTLGSRAVTGTPSFGYQRSGNDVIITIYNQNGSVAGSAFTDANAGLDLNYATFAGFDFWNPSNGIVANIFGNVLSHNGTPS